jgi:hypothetical protein
MNKSAILYHEKKLKFELAVSAFREAGGILTMSEAIMKIFEQNPQTDRKNLEYNLKGVDGRAS